MTTENVIEFSNRPLKLEARPQLQLPRERLTRIHQFLK